MKSFQYALLLALILAMSSMVACQQQTDPEKTAEGLRTKNCEKYKDESGKDTAEYDADEIKDTREIYTDKYGSDNPLYEMVINDADEADLINKFVAIAIPWAVIFVLSIFGFMSYCYCCCCPKCGCCCKKDSYSKRDIQWPLVGIIVFSVYVFFSGVFGAARSATFTQDWYMVKCSMMGFLADFVTGKTVNEGVWIGLEDLTVELNQAAGSFYDDVNATFSGDDILTAQQTALETAFTAIKEKQGATCNFIQGEGVYNQNATPNAACFYDYDTNLGTTDNTSHFLNSEFVGQLVAMNTVVYTAFPDLKTEVDNTNTEGRNMATGDFKTSMDDAITSIDDLIKSLNDTAFDFEDGTKDADDVLPIINSVFMAFFVVTLLFAVLNLLVAVLYLFKKPSCPRHVFNIGWCLYMILCMIGFLLCTIFTVVSEGGFMYCDMMDRVLNDRETFENFDTLNSGSTGDYIKRCKIEYGGDGNIASELGILDSLNEMKSLSEGIDTAVQANQQFITGGKADLVASINYLKTNMISMAQHNTFDAFDGTNNGQTLPATLIATHIPNGLNTHTPDTTTGDFASAGPNYNVNRYMNTAAYADWTFPDHSATFAQNVVTAPGFDFSTITFGDGAGTDIQVFDTKSLLSSAASNQDITNTANAGWTYIENKNDNVFHHFGELEEFSYNSFRYFGLVDEWMHRVGEFDTATNGFIDSMIDTLTNKMNCLFLGENLQNVQDSLCVGLFSAVHLMTENIKVHCFGMLFGSLFIFFARYRLPKYLKEGEKQNAVGDNNAVKADGYNNGGAY